MDSLNLSARCHLSVHRHLLVLLLGHILENVLDYPAMDRRARARNHSQQSLGKYQTACLALNGYIPALYPPYVPYIIRQIASTTGPQTRVDIWGVIR
jgi:hypothetical protein